MRCTILQIILGDGIFSICIAVLQKEANRINCNCILSTEKIRKVRVKLTDNTDLRQK